MESLRTDPVPHGYAEARRVLSNCWIYTPDRGLRALTLHGNGSTLAVDGRHLRRWCILEQDTEPRRIIAYLYAEEDPTSALREEVARRARARFANCPAS
jgi:hypothetical protein